MSAVVVVRCKKCKDTRNIGSGEVGPGEYPMCDRCFYPMFPIAVKGWRP